MNNQSTSSPSKLRVAAGKLNQLKRGKLSSEGRQLLREAALANQPWTRSTGPRTPEGKKRSAANGRWRQKGSRSMRELLAELAEVSVMLQDLRDLRVAATGSGESTPME